MMLKRTLTIFCCVALASVLATPTAACDNPYDVKVLYIVPHGQTADSAGVLADVFAAQAFVRDEMARHGFGGDRTFKIAEFQTVELNADNWWTLERFETLPSSDLTTTWVEDQLNRYDAKTYHRVYLFLVEGATSVAGGPCGIAGMFVNEGWDVYPSVGGWSFVGLDTPCPDRAQLIAHEMGHAFGLDHNPDPSTTMYRTAGENQRKFTEEECGWLDGSRYFADDHTDVKDLPGIQLVSVQNAQLDGEHSVEMEFRVTSHVGVSMFQLAKHTYRTRVAMASLDTWQTSLMVNIPRDVLEGETTLRASVLDAQGAIGWQEFLFGMPPVMVDQHNAAAAVYGTQAVAWASLKTASPRGRR